jgi:hypothetical protein
LGEDGRAEGEHHHDNEDDPSHWIAPFGTGRRDGRRDARPSRFTA